MRQNETAPVKRPQAGPSRASTTFLGPQEASGDPGLPETSDHPYRLRHAGQRVFRSWWVAKFVALQAEKAGLALGEFLEMCRSSYARFAPQVNISNWRVFFDGGMRLERPQSGFEVPTPANPDRIPTGFSDRVGILAAVSRSGAEQLCDSVNAKQAEVARIDAKLPTANAALDERRSSRSTAVAKSEAGLTGAAGKIGRPVQRYAAAIAGLWTLAMLGLACEAAFIIVPILNLWGIDTSRLGAEFDRNPTVVVGGVLSGIALTLWLCVVLFAFVRACGRLVGKEDPDAAQKFAQAGIAIVSGSLSVAAVCAIGAVRSSLNPADIAQSAGGTASDLPAWVFLVLVSIYPVGTAFFLHLIEALHKKREAIRVRQEDWDASQREGEIARARHDELVRIAEDDVRRLETEREALYQDLKALSSFAEAAEARLRERHDAERKASEAYAHSLTSSLAQDWYAFRVAGGAAANAPSPGDLSSEGETEPVRRSLGGLVAAVRGTATILSIIALALTVLGLSACGRSGAAPAPASLIHIAIVCADGDACDPVARGAAFDEWWHNALYKPGSTCVVWLAGKARDDYALVAVAKIPVAWGQNVTAAKAAFHAAARAAVVGKAASLQGSVAVPLGAVPPDGSTPGQHQLAVIGSRKTTTSATTAIPRVDDAGARHDAIVCDASDSGGGRVCNERTLLAMFDAFAIGAAPGATFVVHLVGRSRDSDERLFTVTVSSLPPGPRTAYLLGARVELQAIAASGLRSESSAIIEAMSVAVRDLGAHEHGRLVLLSDLRQVGGRWNFEEAVPPPEAFIEALHAEALFVDLAGIPVTVIGVHHRRGPEGAAFDARAAAAVEETWTAAFTAMGTPSVRIFPEFDTMPAGSL